MAQRDVTQQPKKERKPVVRRSKEQVALDNMKNVNRALKMVLVACDAQNTTDVLALVNEASAFTEKIEEQFGL